jgi:XTP/dITP diphosphohydrolase
MKIILSTRNPSKAEQIQALFKGAPVTVLTLAEAGIEGEGIEDGATLQENAFKKALFAWEQLSEKTWTMADDTGLFIDALDGQPGVKAARWAGESATTDEITQYTLKRLEGVTDRSATFETVVVVIAPSGDQYFFSGAVRGKLAEAPRTKPQPKMPYSPLFVPEGYTKAWAEMTVEEENAVSHRGIAFRKVRAFLE